MRSDKKDPRLVILLKKLQTLKREVQRVPSLVEWEQCLNGILRTGRKLSEFVQNTDHSGTGQGTLLQTPPVTPPVSVALWWCMLMYCSLCARCVLVVCVRSKNMFEIKVPNDQSVYIYHKWDKHIGRKMKKQQKRVDEQGHC